MGGKIDAGLLERIRLSEREIFQDISLMADIVREIRESRGIRNPDPFYVRYIKKLKAVAHAGRNNLSERQIIMHSCLYDRGCYPVRDEIFAS